jgi:hypothetical protein
MDQARIECIECLQKEIDAFMRVHTLELDANLLTPIQYKNNIDRLHSMRIEKEILLGNYPPLEKKKSKISLGQRGYK